MSTVDWVLIVIGTFTVLLTAATLVVASLTLRATNRDVAASEKSLDLARKADARYPQLEIIGVSLAQADEQEEVVKTREAGKVLEKLVEEYNKLYKNKEYGPFRARQAALSQLRKMGFTLKQTEYEGPFPDLILSFRLHNKSSETVRNLVADINFDPEFLKPIDFPTLSQGGGWKNSMKITIESLPPSNSAEAMNFKIALLRKKPGETTVPATFSTAEEGFYKKENIPLEVP